MKSIHTQRPYDLVAVGTVALLSIMLAVVPIDIGAIRAIVAVPAVLFAPGYIIIRLALPGNRMDLLERWALIVAMSIATTILCGVALNFTPFGLGVVPFTVSLGLVTLAGLVVVLVRSGQSSDLPPLALGRGQLMWLGFAVAFVIVACIVSVQGTKQYQNTAFTQVWLTSGGGNAMTLGVHNDEGHTETYRVQLLLDDRPVPVQEWSAVTIGTSQTWQSNVTLNAAPGARLRAIVYRAENPTRIYRIVTITLADDLSASPTTTP